MLTQAVLTRSDMNAPARILEDKSCSRTHGDACQYTHTHTIKFSGFHHIHRNARRKGFCYAIFQVHPD